MSLSSEAVHTFHILLNPQPSKPTTTPTTNTDFLQTCLQQVLQTGTGVKHIKKHTSMSHVRKRSAVLHRSSKPTPIIQPSKPTPEKKFPQTQQTHTEKKKNSQTQQTHIEKLIQKKKNPTLKKKSTNATNLHRKNKTHKPKCKSERIEKI